MKDVRENKFGSFLKAMRYSGELSMRDFASILGISATYISDLENGNRKPTLNLIDKISSSLVLTEEENKKMFDLFSYDRLELYPDLVHYLIDNDLIDSLNILKKYDKDGSKVKTFTLGLKHDNNRK